FSGKGGAMAARRLKIRWLERLAPCSSTGKVPNAMSRSREASEFHKSSPELIVSPARQGRDKVSVQLRAAERKATIQGSRSAALRMRSATRQNNSVSK